MMFIRSSLEMEENNVILHQNLVDNGPSEIWTTSVQRTK